MQKNAIKAFIFAAFVGISLLFPRPGEAKSWKFSNWEAIYRIQEDSTIIVRETRILEFVDSFTWAEAYLLKDRCQDITDVQVFDQAGNPLFSPDAVITDLADRVTIRLNFNAANEERTWIFQYTIVGGIGFFENHDELYWDTLPLDREVAIDQARIQVVLPESAESLAEFPQTMYVGGAGSTTQAKNYTIGSDNKTIEFWNPYLAPYEGITIVASWPKGLVQDPGTLRIEAKLGDQETSADIIIGKADTGRQTPFAFQLTAQDDASKTITATVRKFGYKTETKELTIVRGQTQAYTFTLTEAGWYKAGKYALAVLTILMWIGLIPYSIWHYYRRWQRLGKDPGDKKTIIPQYEPPKGMRPSEMGVVIDEKVQLRDLTAMLVDFAVRGLLIIEETGKRLGRKDYKFIRTDKPAVGLAAYEQEMLKNLFKGESERKLSDLRSEFYAKIPNLRNLLYQDVTAKGYFEQPPDKVRRHYLVKPILLIILGFIGVIVPAIWLPVLAVMFLPLIFIGIISLIFAAVMPRKTEAGAEAKWWIEGFKLYLTTAERFRLGAMTPETFEKYLPYAMVLTVEKQWANRFKDIYTEPPNWYRTTGRMVTAFSVASFTNQLSSFAVTAAGSLGHSPSSSSSGFSGGFSGGGGGGGGASAG